MGVVRTVNRLIDLVLGIVRQFGRGRIWGVLLLWAVVGWLILYGHYRFLSPVFHGVISVWTSLLGEQEAIGFTHYPGHLQLLPYFFGWAKLLVALILEGAVLGAAALMFYRSYEGVEGEEDLSGGASVGSTVLRSWFNLIVVWLVLNGLIVLVNWLLPMLFEPALRYSPRRAMAFNYVAMPGLTMVILALFFYAIPAVVVHSESAFRALGRSLRLFARNPVTSFILAFGVLLIPVIIGKFLENTDVIVSKFRPEMVYWLLVAGLVVDVIAHFFWMGTAVRLIAYEEE
jgi:hypothetical protein